MELLHPATRDTPRTDADPDAHISDRAAFPLDGNDFRGRISVLRAEVHQPVQLLIAQLAHGPAAEHVHAVVIAAYMDYQHVHGGRLGAVPARQLDAQAGARLEAALQPQPQPGLRYVLDGAVPAHLVRGGRLTRGRHLAFM